MRSLENKHRQTSGQPRDVCMDRQRELSSTKSGKTMPRNMHQIRMIEADPGLQEESPPTHTDIHLLSVPRTVRFARSGYTTSITKD